MNLDEDDDFITIKNENHDEQLPASYSLKCFKMRRAFFLNIFDPSYEDVLIDAYGPIFTRLPICHLKITRQAIFVGLLIHLIKHLPNIRSVVLRTLAMVQPRYLSSEEIRTLRSIANENKITHVKLQWTNDLAHVQFILDLCPRIEQLEFDCSMDASPEKVIRFILMKNIEYIPHLSLLTFHIPQRQENLTDLLKRMIDLEQLRHNYTIKQIDNQIHLQWH